MCLHRSSRMLWLLPLALAGCSSTVGSRFGAAPSQSRSIAVVGDRPLPAASGEPGAQAVADQEEPEPRLNPKKRISGRVVDEAGEPVAGATVRLADGGVKGGKEILGTTDRSGGFTLNGLRAGSTYVLIAEAEDQDGPTRGQAEAKTAATGVEIAVVSESRKPTSRRPSRSSKVKSISNREDVGEPADSGPAPRLNRDDVGSSGGDSDSLDAGPPPPVPSRRPQLSPPQPGVGWKNNKTTTASRSADPDLEGDRTSSDVPQPRRRPVAEKSEVNLDESENPLPPAIDPRDDASRADPAPETARKNGPRKVGATGRPKARESGEIALAPEASLDGMSAGSSSQPTPPAAEDLLKAPPSLMADLEPDSSKVADPAEAIASVPVGSTKLAEGPPAIPPIGSGTIQVASHEPPSPTTSPPESSKPTQDVPPANPAPEPVFALNGPTANPAEKVRPPADYNPFAKMADRAVPALDRLPDHPPSEPPPAEEPSTAGVEAAPKRKWGDLASSEPAPEAPVQPKVTMTAALLRRIRPPADARSKDGGVATCTYDARQRKIVDFRLPDLEGKPVRFQELDADFVLLDFWGTWCEPCLNALPHLVDLQKKYGPERLKVVGVACEEVPPERRRAKVDEVARKFGINYPVVLSTMDGKPCPLQQALQIQAMPTMVLVDRKGQVLWRITGATPASEGRLDKVLASTLDRPETARR